MSASALPLQKALYQALTGDPALSQLVNGDVFDYVPEPTTYPWIMIGEDTSIDWNTMDNNGKEVTCTIHSWSRAQGRTELKNIQAAIQRVLNHARISITDGVLVFIQQEFETSMVDPDAVTYHGIQRFRALIQED